MAGRFAVELANTRYRSDREDLDFIAGAADIRVWFRHAPAAAGIAVPRHLPHGTAAAVRQVRDAVRLLSEGVDAARSPVWVQAAEVLHQAARSAAAHLALDTGDGGRPTWRLHHDGREEDVFVADVASRCILFLGGEDAGRVRRCARPACPMFFVQQHRARRFCHETCAHSVRQARYYRSTTMRHTPSEST